MSQTPKNTKTQTNFNNFNEIKHPRINCEHFIFVEMARIFLPRNLKFASLKLNYSSEIPDFRLILSHRRGSSVQFSPIFSRTNTKATLSDGLVLVVEMARIELAYGRIRQTFLQV